jgi:hypothetical protein
MAGEFETFVQTELPLRPFVTSNPAQETVLVRRGAGPRQYEAITIGEGEVLGKVNGQLASMKIAGVIKANVHFDVASTEWLIEHDNQTTDVIVQAFDNDNEVIYPESIKVVDDGTVRILFNSTQQGYARIIFLK